MSSSSPRAFKNGDPRQGFSVLAYVVLGGLVVYLAALGGLTVDTALDVRELRHADQTPAYVLNKLDELHEDLGYLRHKVTVHQASIGEHEKRIKQQDEWNRQQGEINRKLEEIIRKEQIERERGRVRAWCQANQIPPERCPANTGSSGGMR